MADAFRGIVVSAPVKINGGDLQMVANGVSPQELRYALLFWDKIDFPSNSIIHIASSSDFEFLIDEGIAQRTMIDPVMFGTMSTASIIRDCQVAAFRQLDAKVPVLGQCPVPSVPLCSTKMKSKLAGVRSFRCTVRFRFPTKTCPSTTF